MIKDSLMVAVSEALLLKGCGFNKVAIFTTNADAKNKL
jgi:hypothetical protein